MNIYADNRPETIKSLIVWSAALLMLAYQVTNVFVANADMILYVRVLDSAFTATALWIFAPDAWRGVWRAVPKPRDFLIVGIWLKFFSSEMQSIYALIYRLSGSPAWWLNNELLGSTVLISVVAVVCHIATPGGVDNEVPRRSRYGIGIAVGVGFLFVGALAMTKPDIAPWVEMARPYIGDWWKTSAWKALKPISDLRA